jgi:hypothetical protein
VFEIIPSIVCQVVLGCAVVDVSCQQQLWWWQSLLMVVQCWATIMDDGGG